MQMFFTDIIFGPSKSIDAAANTKAVGIAINFVWASLITV